jgi:hypothetical protein
MIEAKEKEFEKDRLGSPAEESVEWEFLELYPPLSDDDHPGHKKLKHQLEVGASLAGKIWRLSPVASSIRLVLVLAALGALVWGVERLAPGLWARLASSWSWFWPWALGAVGALVVVKSLSNRFRLGSFFVRHALSSTIFSLLLVFLWPVAWIHLLLFDKRFLRRGTSADVLKAN